LRSQHTLETILKKDRLFIIGGLLVLCMLAWWYIIYLYQQMNVMNMAAFLFAMPMTPTWSMQDFLLIFLMWFVMMIAMMTPSVTPLILIFAMVNRQKKERRSPFVPTAYLLCGYFLVWAGFSMLATLLQWLLQKISMLNPQMVTTNKILGGLILITAGMFQFTAMKQSCLNSCRNPIDFIHLNWKEGKARAFRMGIEHGFFCLICCWALMILLFVSGIMNLLWIVLIAIFVLIEKALPKMKWISFIAGAVLIVYGALLLLKPWQ
jgi:predicted metal-binding membrane protein